MPSFQDSAPPIELAFAGESKDDPEELLLVAPDGTYYAYSLAEGNPHPVQPDDSWKVEAVSTEELFT